MKTLLVVDDEIANLRLIKDMLSQDYNIISVNSAEDALEYLRSEIPDLILLDVVMPGMGGFELMGRICADRRTTNIPVIFMTEDDDKDEGLQGLALGAMDFITKPIEPRIAKSRIEKVLKVEGLRHRLESEAYRDPLTGLWNRKYAVDRVNTLLVSSNARGAAFMIDIDNFKGINDTYGHAFGDEVLVKISHVLKEMVRLNDIACRMGGDEFFLYFDGISAVDKIEGIAKRLIRSLNRNVKYPDSIQGVGGSIGIAVAPYDGTDFDALYANADKALYASKKNGKNAYRFYSGDNMTHEVPDGDDAPKELRYLIELMNSQEPSKGAYGVEYRDFGNIVSFIRRNIVRSKMHVVYVLFTLKMKDGGSIPAELLRDGIAALERTVRNQLRMGDVAAKCSASQIITMLMNASESDAGIAAERVSRNFMQNKDTGSLELVYEIQDLKTDDPGE